MERRTDVRTEIDNARLVTKLSVIGGIVTIVVLLIPTLVLGVINGEFRSV